MSRRDVERALPRRVWRQSVLAITLALVVGYVDAYAYQSYQLYVSFMSGNTTNAGLHLSGALQMAAHRLWPICCFVAGAFAATLWRQGVARSGARRFFVAPAFLLWLSLASAAWSALPAALEIALLAAAMGALNTSFSRVGRQSLHLAYVTGTLNNFAEHLALWLRRQPLLDAAGAWDTHGRRAALLLAVWLCFLGGAALGGALWPVWKARTLWPPILVLLAVAASRRATKVTS